MGQGILFFNRKQRHAQYASARTLRVVTMVTVTWLVWLDSARTLRVAAAMANILRWASVAPSSA